MNEWNLKNVGDTCSLFGKLIFNENYPNEPPKLYVLTPFVSFQPNIPIDYNEIGVEWEYKAGWKPMHILSYLTKYIMRKFLDLDEFNRKLIKTIIGIFKMELRDDKFLNLIHVHLGLSKRTVLHKFGEFQIRKIADR